MQRPADHHLDDLAVGDLAHRVGADRSAVAQDGHRTAIRPHLLHPVGDEDDGGLCSLLRRHQPGKPFDIVTGERRGRFVQQQQSRAVADAAGDLDLLAARQVQVRDDRPRIDVGQAKPGQIRPGPLLAAPPRGQADAVERLLHQQEVLCHRQVPDQRDFLEGGADAHRMGGARSCDPDGGAEQPDAATVRLRQPAQDPDKRRLAGPVLAQQRMHRADRHIERHAVERDGRAVSLRQIGHLERARHPITARRSRDRQIAFQHSPAPMVSLAGIPRRPAMAASAAAGPGPPIAPPEPCRSGPSRDRAREPPCSRHR